MGPHAFAAYGRGGGGLTTKPTPLYLRGSLPCTPRTLTLSGRMTEKTDM